MQLPGLPAVISDMRLYGRLARFAAGFVALAAAGCGASAPTPKPTVNISITAPTSGSTLGVHRVVVLGTVSPANAQVLVAGQPAQVSGGRFTRSLWLGTPQQVVDVTAQAQGYVAAHAATTINYSPNLAAQLVASASALNPKPAPVGTSSSRAPQASAAAITALNQAVALPRAASSSGASKTRAVPQHAASAPAHTSHAPPAPKPAPLAPAPLTHPAPPPPGPTAPSNPAPSGGGTRQPVSVPPVPTVTRIKQSWDGGCLKHGKGQKVAPYCGCLYNHLSATGAFKTPAAVDALLKKLRAYTRTGDLSALPRAIRLALAVCSAKLPVLTPMTGHPSLTRLPGLSHGRESFPVIVKLRPRSR